MEVPEVCKALEERDKKRDKEKDAIIASQVAEIEQLKAELARLEAKTTKINLKE